MCKIYVFFFVFCILTVKRTCLFRGLGNQAPYIPLLSQRSRLYLKDF